MTGSFAQNHVAPASITPPPAGTECARPPTRVRASTSATRRVRLSWWAAVRPARPAPMTMASTCSVVAVTGDLPLLGSERNGPEPRGEPGKRDEEGDRDDRQHREAADREHGSRREGRGRAEEVGQGIHPALGGGAGLVGDHRTEQRRAGNVNEGPAHPEQDERGDEPADVRGPEPADDARGEEADNAHDDGPPEPAPVADASHEQGDS